MNDGNNQFGLPMVDQMLMSNNNNTSVPPQNNIISQMPVPPQKPNLGGNKGSPLVRRTQMTKLENETHIVATCPWNGMTF